MKLRLELDRRFTHLVIPLLLGMIGAGMAFGVEEIPRFRRHALLIALLAGFTFFHPAIRELVLILFCYGFGFYTGIKAILEGSHWEQLSGAGQLRMLLWVPISLLCLTAALAMGSNPPRRWANGCLFLAIACYFTGYTYGHLQDRAWLEALAGFGLGLTGLLAAWTTFAQAWRSSQVVQPEPSGGSSNSKEGNTVDENPNRD